MRHVSINVEDDGKQNLFLDKPRIKVRCDVQIETLCRHPSSVSITKNPPWWQALRHRNRKSFVPKENHPW